MKVMLVGSVNDLTVQLFQALVATGHQVQLLQDCVTAVGRLPSLKPDVVILDAAVLGVEWVGLAYRAREDRSRVVAIASSAFGVHQLIEALDVTPLEPSATVGDILRVIAGQ